MFVHKMSIYILIVSDNLKLWSFRINLLKARNIEGLQCNVILAETQTFPDLNLDIESALFRNE